MDGFLLQELTWLESNVLEGSLENKESSLVPVISMWSGMTSSGASIVLELVHVLAAALFSNVVCFFCLADMHERQFFSLQDHIFSAYSRHPAAGASSSSQLWR